MEIGYKNSGVEKMMMNFLLVEGRNDDELEKMMINFLLVEGKNDDEFFISIEEKMEEFFPRCYFLCTPIDKTIQNIFYEIKFFFPVYPHCYSITFY